MIDYINFSTRVNKSDFENISFLDFKESYSKKTGLIDNYIEAEYNCMRLKLYNNGLLKVSGSIHKYSNFSEGIKAPNQINASDVLNGFNGNDFCLSRLKSSFLGLLKDLQLKADKCVLKNIEIGLNLKHSYNTENILNGLMLHSGKVFSRPFGFSYREAIHSQYYFKIYDKSLQYGIDVPIIRIELKFKKMQRLNALGLFNLKDLMKDEILNLLLGLVRLEFNNVLLYDYTIDKSRLTAKELIKLKDYSNQVYWQKLKPQNRDKAKKKLNELIKKYSHNLKVKILEWYDAKHKELMNR